MLLILAYPRGYAQVCKSIKGDLPIPTAKEIKAGQHHAYEALEQASEFGVKPGKEEIVSATNH